MRIPNLTMSDAVVDRLNTLRGQQNRLNNQLQTEQRISLASEDPQSATRVMSMRSELAITQQYGRNVATAKGVSDETGSVLSSLFQDVYINATDAATSALGLNSDADLSNLAPKVNELVKQAMQLGNTRFNEQYIFNGTDTGTPPFSADSAEKPTTVTGPTAPTGTEKDGISIKISDSVTFSPYSSGANNAKLSTFIQRLADLRVALENKDRAAVTTAFSNLKSSEPDILSAIAETGTQGQRLESIQTSAEKKFSDLSGMISDEVGVDIPSTMVNLTKTQTAYQAAMQAGPQILRLSLLDYIR